MKSQKYDKENLNMFSKFALVIMVAMITTIAYAQGDNFEEIAHDTRQIAVGVDGAGDDNSISATLVVPFTASEGKINGWAGGFTQQQSSDGEVTSQVQNGHAEAGYSVHERVSINAFGDYLRDKQRGIEGQAQLGAFVEVDIYDDQGWVINGGAGNYVENKQARDDLGLTDDDPNVVRALAYVKAYYGRYSVIYKFTPQIDFSDLQMSIAPTATYSLSDTLSLNVKGVIGYESEPLVEGEELYTSYALQLSATF